MSDVNVTEPAILDVSNFKISAPTRVSLPFITKVRFYSSFNEIFIESNAKKEIKLPFLLKLTVGPRSLVHFPSYFFSIYRMKLVMIF